MFVVGCRASSAPLLQRIAIGARVWRRGAIAIASCLSTMPTLHHATVAVVDANVDVLLIFCHHV